MPTEEEVLALSCVGRFRNSKKRSSPEPHVPSFSAPRAGHLAPQARRVQ